MKHYTFDHPFGWISVTYVPGVPWKLPHRARGNGWRVLPFGKVSIGIGWHWPPRAPVCG